MGRQTNVRANTLAKTRFTYTQQHTRRHVPEVVTSGSIIIVIFRAQCQACGLPMEHRRSSVPQPLERSSVVVLLDQRLAP